MDPVEYGESSMTWANEPPKDNSSRISNQRPRLRFKPAEYMKKIIGSMRKIKAGFSRLTTRHPFSGSLLCSWILAAGLPVPVLSQNYSSPYTFTTIAGKVGSPGNADGVVTTLAGKAGVAGSADGMGSTARFHFGVNINNSGGGGYVVVDPAGNLYVPDFGNYTIRKGYPPLVMTSSGPGLGSNGGPFAFTLTGPSGQSVVVESSSDLVNWLPIWTNTLTFPEALTFRDPQNSVDLNRFYRAFTK